ncbi:MAG: hypothetical protein ACE5OR_09555 [bacterium]
MVLQDIKAVLDAEVLAGEGSLGIEVTAAKASDLMSDVLTLADPGALLITGLTNVQVLRTAEVAELSAVVFVRGKRPGPRPSTWPGRRTSPCWPPDCQCTSRVVSCFRKDCRVSLSR